MNYAQKRKYCQENKVQGDITTAATAVGKNRSDFGAVIAGRRVMTRNWFEAIDELYQICRENKKLGLKQLSGN